MPKKKDFIPLRCPSCLDLPSLEYMHRKADWEVLSRCDSCGRVSRVRCRHCGYIITLKDCDIYA